MSLSISRASRAVLLHQIELTHQFSDSPKLDMSVRIVSSKQVFPLEDEEEGEILYNLRIDVGCNPHLV
jgi:hypothetical protein